MSEPQMPQWVISMSTSVGVKGFGSKVVNVKGVVAEWPTQPWNVESGPISISQSPPFCLCPSPGLPIYAPVKALSRMRGEEAERNTESVHSSVSLYYNYTAHRDGPPRIWVKGLKVEPRLENS